MLRHRGFHLNTYSLTLVKNDSFFFNKKAAIIEKQLHSYYSLNSKSLEIDQNSQNLMSLLSWLVDMLEFRGRVRLLHLWQWLLVGCPHCF